MFSLFSKMTAPAPSPNNTDVDLSFQSRSLDIESAPITRQFL